MKLRDLIPESSIIPELASDDRNGAIRELVQLLAEVGRIEPSDVETYSRAVITRERTRGTSGFGKGMAVPHAKVDGIDHVVAAVGRSLIGIDFASLDGQPVFGVFLLISPSEVPELHLKAMDAVFQPLHLEKFRKFLRQADTPEKIHELLKEADDKLLS